jgi:F-type H+-transporting ATPase subunit gamma
MEGLRELKRRIRGIRNTQQITRAMNMVAAAKFRRTQPLVTTIKPYVEGIEEVMVNLLNQDEPLEHPFFSKGRGERRPGIIVITGDRGLSGGFNTNVIKKALEVDTGEASPILLCVGRKARDYFVKRDYDVRSEYIGISDQPDLRLAKNIAGTAIELFQAGDIDELYLAYTEFVTTITRQPQLIRLLPVAANGYRNPEGARKSPFIYEPDPESVLDELLPHYIEVQIYRGLIDSKVSEFAARMMAMDAATDNAEEMIEHLTLSLNRARQAAITQELSEIVSGAEALK